MTSSASPPAGAFAVATTAYGGGGAGTVTAVLLGATLPQVDPASLPGASYFQFEEMTPPSTPSANRVRLFVPTETPAVNRLNVLDATGQTVALSGVLFREVGNPIKNIVNTTTETSLFTTAPTIKGGTLGTSRGLRVTVFLDLLNDTGGGITTTVRMKYGGTTFGTLNGVAIDASATRFAFRYDGLLHAVGATNAQIGSLSGLYDPSAGNAGVTGGQPGAALPAGHSPHTGLTVDSTADQTLEITAQHSSASSNLSVRPYLILVELL
jgi:hypothetical protein